jgi:hypothetical protein
MAQNEAYAGQMWCPSCQEVAAGGCGGKVAVGREK